MHTVTVVFLACFLAISARAEGLVQAGYSLIVDCSGCNADEKSAAASTRPSASALVFGDASRSEIDVDVTDFSRGLIVRYRVTLSRTNGRITRRAMPIDVPPATEEAFIKALEVLNTIEFIRPGEVDIVAHGARAARIRTSYPSAFDLIDDNGYQEVKFSKSLNRAKWPNPESAAFAASDFGEVINATLPVMGDYLEGRTALVAEAKDGTLIIVEARIAVGMSGTSILWQVAENGLRRADGHLARN